MENQDNLFEQFKKAAENSETKDFPGLEKVWSRVDAKLDTQVYKTQKSTNLSWKKFAVAASVAIGIVFIYTFSKENPVTVSSTKSVVVKDSEVASPTIEENEAIVSTESENVVSASEANKIIEKQLQQPNAVAMQETKTSPLQADTIPLAKPMVASMAAPRESDETVYAKSFNSADKGYLEDNSEAKKETRSKQVSKKAPPLIVADGKVVKEKNISKLEDLETIVELKNPLYIINGVEYTEKEVFGPNATSPYYPLQKQEIESVTIYQNEEAIENYGEKGENGVVVIKTKNGKPLKSTR